MLWDKGCGAGVAHAAAAAQPRRADRRRQVRARASSACARLARLTPLLRRRGSEEDVGHAPRRAARSLRAEAPRTRPPRARAAAPRPVAGGGATRERERGGGRRRRREKRAARAAPRDDDERPRATRAERRRLGALARGRLALLGDDSPRRPGGAAGGAQREPHRRRARAALAHDKHERALVANVISPHGHRRHVRDDRGCARAPQVCARRRRQRRRRRRRRPRRGGRPPRPAPFLSLNADAVLRASLPLSRARAPAVHRTRSSSRSCTREGTAADAVKGTALRRAGHAASIVSRRGGATDLARATHHLAVDASCIENKWLGESEKHARRAPCRRMKLHRRRAPLRPRTPPPPRPPTLAPPAALRATRHLDEDKSILSRPREHGEDTSHGTLTSVKTTLMQERADGLRTTADRASCGSTRRPFERARAAALAAQARVPPPPSPARRRRAAS